MAALKNIAILIPAAGASSRMGTTKQLLPWGNTTLIDHCIETAQKLKCGDIVVVLGANFEEIQNTIRKKNVTILNHYGWQNGLGSSISFGIKYIETIEPKVDGVLILLADQPLIDSKFLTELISKFVLGNQQIVATGYHPEKQGVPALFDRDYFAELTSLENDKGAKALLKRHGNRVIAIPAYEKTADIDTEEDYRKLYDANHQ